MDYKNRYKNSLNKSLQSWNRLLWAVDFAARDLSKISNKLLQQLRNELLSFLQRPDEQKKATSIIDGGNYDLPGNLILIPYLKLPDYFSVIDFLRLQKAFAQIFVYLIESQEFYGGTRFHVGIVERERLIRTRRKTLGIEKAIDIAAEKFPIKWPEQNKPSFEMKLNFLPGFYTGGNVIYGASAPENIAILHLLFLLASEFPKTELIGRCPNCQRIFARSGKRLYCSPPCSKIMTQRNWRKERKRKKLKSSIAR